MRTSSLVSSLALAFTTLAGGACGSNGADDVSDAQPAADSSVAADAGAVADASAADAAIALDAAAPAWAAPNCTTVMGSPAVTFTLDEGATLAPAPDISGVVYTAGLVALETPNALLAASGGAILRSDDAGCTWASIGAVAAGYLKLVTNGGDIAYGFADNGDVLVRVEAAAVTSLTAPTSSIVGLGVDGSNPNHVRIGDSSGRLYDSSDGGMLWTPIGTSIPNVSFGYRVAFDANDIDHVLHGAASVGVSTSANGGDSWTPATGLSTGMGGMNAFSIEVSPANGQLVWVQGIDLGPDERRIYRSVDGGLTFAPVVTQSVDVVMTNGILMAPHPTDQDVVYFEFGTYFQGYGTDIYRYDHSDMQVTTTHNANDDISAFAFNPSDSSVMYFGRTSEDIVFSE